MSSARSSASRRRGLVAVTLTAALIGGGLFAATPAIAAPVDITVTSTADSDGTGACENPAVTTTASPVTLRNALCVASNRGGESEITVPAGDYVLSNGALTLGTTSGTTVLLESTGGRANVIGDGTTQLLSLDPGLIGGIDVTIDGFSFAGGYDDTYGGGAIIGGSGGRGTDSLTIVDSVFTDNASAGGPFNPGGAVQFIGGNLRILDSTFQSNTSGSASGGAVYYAAFGVNDTLAVLGSTFRGNTLVGTNDVAAGGGALAYSGSSAGGTLIANSTFVENSAQSSTSTRPLGGAILQENGSTVLSGNRFHANHSAQAADIELQSGTVTGLYNSFTGSAGAVALKASNQVPVTLTDNWWGCNGGPGTAGCTTIDLPIGASTSHLVLRARSGDSDINAGTSTTLTADLLTNSNNQPVSPSALQAFSGVPITWSAATPDGSSVTPTTSPLVNGAATTTFTAGTTGGAGGASASLNAATATATLNIAESQDTAFTSAVQTSGTVGWSFTFTISAVGIPTPEVELTSGTLPAGLSLSGSGAELSLAGTPTTVGLTVLEFTADNGDTSATQTLTIYIDQAPSFTGARTASVEKGEELDLTITTAGTPDPVITAVDLPDGLTLDDNGDGTAHLHGTPAVAPGVHPFILQAINTRGGSSVIFELTVTADPSFTSSDRTTFTVGQPGSFTLGVDGGYPVLQNVSLTDAPEWVELIGDPGSQVLRGTPPAGSGGEYEFTLSIDGSDVEQTFTVYVTEAPVFTGSLSTSVEKGDELDVTVTAVGTPDPAIASADLPDGLTLDDNGDGTARLHGTPDVAPGVHPFLLLADNDAGSASTTFELTVTADPSFTSSDRTTFTVGQAGSFSLGVDGGYPVLQSVTLTDAPEWVELIGDPGSQVLRGTPPAGSGGEYEFTLSIDGSDVTQTFTLAAVEAPAFTGSLSASVEKGGELDVTITTAGTPDPAITAADLPDGLTLDDNGDGTARLHGTPDVAPGVHPFELVATNAVDSASETFELTVTADPSFTSSDRTTFTVGQAGSFSLGVDGGYPVLQSVTLTDAPEWVELIGDPGSQVLRGTPPAGSGGEYEFTLSIDGSDVTQTFTLVAVEAPQITAQPAPVTTLEAEAVSFSVGVSGFPAPTIQWQRGDGQTWTDIDDATASTLTFTTAITDDGALFRAVVENEIDVVTSDEVLLTVGQAPAISAPTEVSTLAGAPLSIDVTSSRLPVSTIAGIDLPAWLTLASAGDGTAIISGTPAAADAGEYEVTVIADNGFGTAETSITITVADTVALPETAPTASDGLLAGVPDSVSREQEITVSGAGFLAGSTVQLGMYSTLTELGTALVEDDGTFSADVVIPADAEEGDHTIAASGISATGTPRLLAADTEVEVLVPGDGDGDGDGTDGGGTDGGASDGENSGAGATDADDDLATTGLDSAWLLTLILGAGAVATAGIVLVRRRSTRRL